MKAAGGLSEKVEELYQNLSGHEKSEYNSKMYQGDVLKQTRTIAKNIAAGNHYIIGESQGKAIFPAGISPYPQMTFLSG